MTNRTEISQWYDKHHAAHGDESWRPRESYRAFLNLLGLPGKVVGDEKRLLDIGSGTGFLLSLADECGLKTFGLDISAEGAKLAKVNSPNSDLRVGSGEEIPHEDNSFDFLCCIGVLEHFLDIPKGLTEMRRVTKPDARLCVVVPNRDFLLWKIKGQPGTAQQDINETLLSMAGWSAMIEQAGFDILSTHNDSYHAHKSNWLIRLAWAFLPLRFTYQIVFILRAKQL